MSYFANLKKMLKREEHLTVSFYLTGGQTVVLEGVKEIKTTKTSEGNFASYSIEWHEGCQPPFFSIALDHISAIIAHKE